MNVQTPPAATVEARSDRLAARLAERELDSLLVTNLLNVRYLTGFTGTNGACIVTHDERLFLTDFRYVEQAEAQVRGLRAGRVRARHARRPGRAPARPRRLRGLARDRGHARQARRRSSAEGVELVAAGTLVEELRAVKDPAEMAAMRAAAELADAAYRRHAASGGSPGAPSARWRSRPCERWRTSGAEGPSFPPIVAAGPAGALPHAVPRDVEIPRGRAGGRRHGGEARRLLLGLHPHARHRPARTTARSRSTSWCCGRSRRRSARCARAPRCPRWTAWRATIIEAAGHGERFGHGLGHGVGLEVHEGPRRGEDGHAAAAGRQRGDRRARGLHPG